MDSTFRSLYLPYTSDIFPIPFISPFRDALSDIILIASFFWLY